MGESSAGFPTADGVCVTAASSPAAQSGAPSPGRLRQWSSRHSLLLLALAALGCLLPFSTKAFHVDDPLFVWTAQNIAQHPLDPYGFRVNWYGSEAPVADVTKNPPLAAYYLAAAGTIFGWSERALHFALALPALAAVLGTYQLARRFTSFPLFAGAAVLFAPGFLVSSTTVMCDVLMLALWMHAVIFWMEGQESRRHTYLAAAALLIAGCALTKYFGLALLPLLLVCSLLKKRRFDFTVAYLVFPAALLAAYQIWTRRLYGRGLLSDAVEYASMHNRGHELSLLAKALVGLSFAGGCMLPALLLAPLLWRRKWSFLGVAAGLVAGLVIAVHSAWFNAPYARPHWALLSFEMAIFAVGGISAVAVAFRGIRYDNAEELLLTLWVAGTFFFAAFVNWTINARSILPMIPAAAILMTRQLEVAGKLSAIHFPRVATALLLGSAAISLWAARADARLANAGRDAAAKFYGQLSAERNRFSFEGHWGFQYYMQKLGAQPTDLRNTSFRAGDVVVIPENSTNTFGPPPGYTLSGTITNIAIGGSLATMSQPLGAGFYASVWGPLPFAVGPVPAERYMIARLVPLSGEAKTGTDGRAVVPACARTANQHLLAAFLRPFPFGLLDEELPPAVPSRDFRAIPDRRFEPARHSRLLAAQTAD